MLIVVLHKVLLTLNKSTFRTIAKLTSVAMSSCIFPGICSSNSDSSARQNDKRWFMLLVYTEKWPPPPVIWIMVTHHIIWTGLFKWYYSVNVSADFLILFNQTKWNWYSQNSRLGKMKHFEFYLAFLVNPTYTHTMFEHDSEQAMELYKYSCKQLCHPYRHDNSFALLLLLQ